jgi:hypothetical protein
VVVREGKIEIALNQWDADVRGNKEELPWLREPQEGIGWYYCSAQTAR